MGSGVLDLIEPLERIILYYCLCVTEASSLPCALFRPVTLAPLVLYVILSMLYLILVSPSVRCLQDTIHLHGWIFIQVFICLQLFLLLIFFFFVVLNECRSALLWDIQKAAAKIIAFMCVRRVHKSAHACTHECLHGKKQLFPHRSCSPCTLAFSCCGCSGIVHARSCQAASPEALCGDE